MKRTKVQALETRATILDAAEIVFFRNSVAKTTLDKIADAAGVTRGAIYGHFKNKDALFDAIFERSALPLDPFAIPAPKDESNPLGRLQTELEARLSLATRVARLRQLYSVVFARCESTVETAMFSRRVRAASRQAETQIEQALRHAVSHEQLSGDLDVCEAALFIHASLTGVLRKDLLRHRHDTRLDSNKIIRTIFHCVIQ